MPYTNFEETSLWRQAFVDSRSDASLGEQSFFQSQYRLLRDKAASLVASIQSDLPGLTIHDVSHLDALWEMASLLAGESIQLNPAEAFVFGAAILLHDSGMSLAAYPNRMDDLKATTHWQDMAAHSAKAGNIASDQELASVVLRRLHAEKAAELPLQPFFLDSKNSMFLIEETELRRFYGRSIGLIAYSHWWSSDRLEKEFIAPLGAYSPITRCSVDGLKLACLLRVADAIYLDRRRAPIFRRALVRPRGVSALHWDFQEKLAAPHLDADSLVFTASEAFPREQNASWWLAYETIEYAEKELISSNQLLAERNGARLAAIRIKGAQSPEQFAQFVPVEGWKPVESKIHASSIPRIVESFGGSKLYGNDPLVAVRELIQNGRDAIHARRVRQKRAKNWGGIKVTSFEREGRTWLSIEDNGVGMSERVLVGPLIDFGVSFWSSPMLHEEFPGLATLGIEPVGRFGVGFFSAFMLGKVVRVISRPYDKGDEQSLVLEFREGISSRPILYRAGREDGPIDGGTRVEILLDQPDVLKIRRPGASERFHDFKAIVAAICPTIDVNIRVDNDRAIKASDWRTIKPRDLCERFMPFMEGLLRGTVPRSVDKTMTALYDAEGELLGRLSIYPSGEYTQSAIVTVGGMTSAGLLNVAGVVRGRTTTVARNEVELSLAPGPLAEWASEQATIVKRARVHPAQEASSAEIILDCGGDPRSLVVARLGDDWISQKQVAKTIRKISEIIVHFGEISFEDEDGVPKSVFDNVFQQDKRLMVLPRYDGRIRPVRARSIGAFDYRREPYQLEMWFRRQIEKTWKEFSEDDELFVVGTVDGMDIIRTVTKFSRH